jgi:hypothetical protein
LSSVKWYSLATTAGGEHVENAAATAFDHHFAVAGFRLVG